MQAAPSPTPVRDRVLLAGKPEALEASTQVALREAKLNSVLFLGCDALALLQDLHQRLQQAAVSAAGEQA